jgi:hypothetical protein
MRHSAQHTDRRGLQCTHDVILPQSPARLSSCWKMPAGCTAAVQGRTACPARCSCRQCWRRLLTHTEAQRRRCAIATEAVTHAAGRAAALALARQARTWERDAAVRMPEATGGCASPRHWMWSKRGDVNAVLPRSADEHSPGDRTFVHHICRALSCTLKLAQVMRSGTHQLLPGWMAMCRCIAGCGHDAVEHEIFVFSLRQVTCGRSLASQFLCRCINCF